MYGFRKVRRHCKSVAAEAKVSAAWLYHQEELRAERNRELTEQLERAYGVIAQTQISGSVAGAF
jgi:hypothetical protein